MSTSEPPTEEELRAAYEAEMRNVRAEHVMLDSVVALVNLGMRRTGLAPGTESERDLVQVKVAIDSVRALLPVIDAVAGEHAKAIRDALSQLQMAYVRIGGQPPAEGEQTAPATDAAGSAAETAPPKPGPEPGKPGGSGPAQSSGRLWVPGR